MTNRLRSGPQSLRRIEVLFDTMGHTRLASAGIVLLSVEEPPDVDPTPTWAIVYGPVSEDEPALQELRIESAGPRHLIDL